MNLHDLEAAKILFLFDSIIHINNTQGIDAFDMMEEESISIIDEILNFKYNGENSNIINGFKEVHIWYNGLKLLRERILELSEKTA